MNYREKINGSNFQVEARIGRYNTAMMLFGLIPEDLILEQVDENRRKLQALLLLSLLIIVLMSLVLAFDFIVPIRQLTYGARKVSEQSYQYRIKSERNDELGLLLQTFNRMTRGLQEKELMGKMVSNSARYYTSDTEGVSNAEKGISLDVSVVYIAVPEFSMFVDSMGPVELIAELKEHIDQVCKIILANGGDIDKLMGEKVLAVFYDEKGLKQGVNSAVAAIEQIRLAERQGRLRFPVTVGLHSGEVLAGLLGIGADRDFTLIGDTVNTAARISSQASLLPRERFLISQVSADLQSNKKVELRDFGEVELKGKAGTMKLYQLFFRG
jgi:adenylate cyclase